MVESTASARQQIGDSILATARELFAKAEDLPIVIEKEDGNVTVRQTWDGDKMVSIGEAKVVEGVVPEDFKEFFSRWHEPDVGIKANPILVSV